MKSIFAISAVLVAINAAPAAAHDYPWCSRTITNEFGDCSFTSFPQCMATVSGQSGDCIQNPRLAFGQAPGWRNHPPAGRQHGAWQDNGWNNRW
jgi:Protein of unknown function (DUF3551)